MSETEADNYYRSKAEADGVERRKPDPTPAERRDAMALLRHRCAELGIRVDPMIRKDPA